MHTNIFSTLWAVIFRTMFIISFMQELTDLITWTNDETAANFIFEVWVFLLHWIKATWYLPLSLYVVCQPFVDIACNALTKQTLCLLSKQALRPVSFILIIRLLLDKLKARFDVTFHKVWLGHLRSLNQHAIGQWIIRFDNLVLGHIETYDRTDNLGQLILTATIFAFHPVMMTFICASQALPPGPIDLTGHLTVNGVVRHVPISRHP